MINNLKNLLLATFVICCSVTASAQEETVTLKTPRFVSEKGYWVIESNIKKPKEVVVYFYNLENDLVYKEDLKNVNLNINRTRVKMRLKRALEQAIATHERGELAAKDDKIVAAIFRKN